MAVEAIAQSETKEKPSNAKAKGKEEDSATSIPVARGNDHSIADGNDHSVGLSSPSSAESKQGKVRDKAMQQSGPGEPHDYEACSTLVFHDSNLGTLELEGSRTRSVPATHNMAEAKLEDVVAGSCTRSVPATQNFAGDVAEFAGGVVEFLQEAAQSAPEVVVGLMQGKQPAVLDAVCTSAAPTHFGTGGTEEAFS